MSAIGVFLIGPFNKVWFLNIHPHLMRNVLPKIAPKTYKNCSKLAFVATSVFAETFVMAWPYNASFVFTNNMLKTRGDVMNSYKIVKKDLRETMYAGWKIYPISQIGIYMIPRHFRAFVDSFVDLVWSTVISNL